MEAYEKSATEEQGRSSNKHAIIENSALVLHHSGAHGTRRHQRSEQVNNRYERFEAVDTQAIGFTTSAPCPLICGAKLKASEKQRSSAMPFCRKAECADSTMPTEPQA